MQFVIHGISLILSCLYLPSDFRFVQIAGSSLLIWMPFERDRSGQPTHCNVKGAIPIFMVVERAFCSFALTPPEHLSNLRT